MTTESCRELNRTSEQIAMVLDGLTGADTDANVEILVGARAVMLC